ncbi:site-specific integrase (plasmid) [Campylobacterota bacterium DY0563]
MRWLSDGEVERIWAAAEQLGPEYEIRIHLGLDLCLRKVEMFRLKISDFWRAGNGHGKIRVLGKGRDGGKEAYIPFHPDTEYYLERYLNWREEQFRKAEERGLRIEEEARESLLIWYREDMGIGKEHYTTMDNRLTRISRLSGVRFSYHDLRRTGARFYWEQGWPLVAIQHLLRHEKIETTIRYLGLRYDIVEEALWAQRGRGAGRPLPLQVGKTNSVIFRI